MTTPAFKEQQKEVLQQQQQKKINTENRCGEIAHVAQSPLKAVWHFDKSFFFFFLPLPARACFWLGVMMACITLWGAVSALRVLPLLSEPSQTRSGGL